jgi:hypothetical protein
MQLNIATGNKTKTLIKIEGLHGVGILSGDGLTPVAWFVHDDHDVPALYVYADPQSEEPTHKINLSKVLKSS